MTESKLRIAKFIADNGYCSRRSAEKLISDKRVKLNGEIVSTPATFITKNSIVEIDNVVIKTSDKVERLWIYNKPAGLVTTERDEKGRPTIFSALPKWLPRVISVGRLDMNSEGLLLLTNSGILSRYFELPSNNFVRVYRVRAFGQFDYNQLKEETKKGITIEGIYYKPMQISLIKGGLNSWFEVRITEGKNREIRRIFEYLGLKVSRLIRIAYGPFLLGDLALGEVKEIYESVGKNEIH